MEADCTGGSEPMHTIPDYLVLAQKKRDAERAVIDAAVAYRGGKVGYDALCAVVDRLIALG